MLELLIADSEECRAVAGMSFNRATYKHDFKVAMRKAIIKARKRLTQ